MTDLPTLRDRLEKVMDNASRNQPCGAGPSDLAAGEAGTEVGRALDPRYWEVEVRIEGVSVLVIGHDHVAGLSDLDPYADRIRACAEHLSSFIGTGEPEPCFGCGGSEQERWLGDGNTEMVGPCSVCCPEAPLKDPSA